MERRVVVPAVTLERRQVAAAWEALERAEALLPPGHPAAWHLQQTLAAVAADWQTRQRPDVAAAELQA